MGMRIRCVLRACVSYTALGSEMAFAVLERFSEVYEKTSPDIVDTLNASRLENST